MCLESLILMVWKRCIFQSETFSGNSRRKQMPILIFLIKYLFSKRFKMEKSKYFCRKIIKQNNSWIMLFISIRFASRCLWCCFSRAISFLAGPRKKKFLPLIFVPAALWGQHCWRFRPIIPYICFMVFVLLMWMRPF